jgi:hypothetical protein
MPERTPAELLTAAADKLDALLAGTTPGPWAIWRDLDHQGFHTVGDLAGVVPDGAVESAGEANPTAHVYVEPDAAYIAAMHPGVGRALAALLRRHGQIAVGWTDTEEVFPEELRLARAILGTKEGT